MYTKLSLQLILAIALMSSFAIPATTSENFNSRKGIGLKGIKSKLQSSCWTIHHFDINNNGWNPLIEGDGALVSSHSALNSANAGIYTPLLSVGNTLAVSFDYRFSEDFDAATGRWIKLCLATSNNAIVQTLEEITVAGINATGVKKYSTEFKNIVPGNYRFILLYGGSGGSANIAFDNLQTSAPTKFSGGCGIVPEAKKLSFIGNYDRTAKGSLFNNDEASSNLHAFLVEDAHDGKVELFPDGTFVFIPDSGFRGKNTSFKYRVCSEGNENLCSLPAGVTIAFTNNNITRFNGSYQHHGNVELAWNTSDNAGVSSFEVERSMDGRSWRRSGIVKIKDEESDKYSYVDQVKKNTALKRDLYYRLKQIGTDGSTSTTKPIIVRVYNTNSVTMICVAPNFYQRQVTLNVQLPESALISIRIFDNLNKTVIHELANGVAGLNNITVEGSQNLVPGNYIMDVIVNSKERMLVKLLKEK